MGQFLKRQAVPVLAIMVLGRGSVLPAPWRDLAAAAQAGEDPITVEISVPLDRNGLRTIEAANVRDVTKFQHVHVVVSNSADIPVRLWRQWCFWGYNSLEFELQGPDGKLRRIWKQGRSWHANFPDWWTLPPGELWVIDVYLMPTIWRLDPLQDLLGRETDVRIRPVFSITPDDEATKHRVWTGRIYGPWLDVRLRYRKISEASTAPRVHTSPVSDTVRIVGSDTMVNLVQIFAQSYIEVCRPLSIQVQGGGSGVGIATLLAGRADIACASRAIKDAERQRAKAATGRNPVEWIVAYDALSVCVHHTNPIGELTVEELARIYGSERPIDRWSELGVRNATIVPGADIVRVGRQSSSGTYHFFRTTVLQNVDYRPGIRTVAGSKDVVDVVGSTPLAIGYVGMGYMTEGVKPLKLTPGRGKPACAPTPANVRNGTYPLARPLRLYTLGRPTGEVKEFLAWILSPAGQRLVSQAGYVPVN